MKKFAKLMGVVSGIIAIIAVAKRHWLSRRRSVMTTGTTSMATRRILRRLCRHAMRLMTGDIYMECAVYRMPEKML